MRKFEVGDRVRVVAPASSQRGLVFTVRDVRPAKNACSNGWFSCGELVCELDHILPDGKRFAMPPSALRHVYDGDEASSWQAVRKACGWMPEKVREQILNRRDVSG